MAKDMRTHTHTHTHANKHVAQAPGQAHTYRHQTCIVQVPESKNPAMFLDPPLHLEQVFSLMSSSTW